jgi:uncharacterized protein (DUF2147 family)
MKAIFRLFAVFLCLSIQPAAADDARDPAGLWLTAKKDTVVHIEHCGDSLCGYIVWLRSDVEKTTPRGEPMCGQKVLWGVKQSSSDPSRWEGGHIYKADDDKEYDAWVRLKDNGKLKLRVYKILPFLGKSKTLTRTTEAEYPPCSQ